MIIINNFSRVFHMGCEYCSMSYNVKICQNQQLMCTCCEGDPLHPSAYYRLGFCGRPSVCVRFFSQTHMTYYTHKTDIFSICCHAAVHKPGENQAQNSASKKKNTNIRSSTQKMHFMVFLYQPVLMHSYTKTRVWNHTPLHSVSHSLYYSTLPPTHKKMCKKTLPHKQNTHRIFLWEMALKGELGNSLSHSKRHPTHCS